MRYETGKDQSKTVCYDSMDSFAQDFDRTRSACANCEGEWVGYTTADQAVEMARMGWSDCLPEVLDIVDHAVSTVEHDTTRPGFETVYSVEGCDVDVGRFLGGEPENMVSYPLIDVPRTGRIITLVASICYSASVDYEAMKARGMVISALCFALDRLGFGTELWADISIGGDYGPNNRTRIRIKGLNEILDPARIVYAFGHVGFYRWLGFGNPNFHHGRPVDPLEDMPEGTIYLPAVCTAHGKTRDGIVKEVKALLKQYGIIE
jgi:hypothetical protein